MLNLMMTKAEAAVQSLLDQDAEVRTCCEYCAREIAGGTHDILFDVGEIIVTPADTEEVFCGLCKLPLYAGKETFRAVFLWDTEDEED